MRHRRTLAVALSVFLAGTPLVAFQSSDPPDISGTWTGKFKTESKDQPPREEAGMLVLVQKGTVISGTAGPDVQRQQAITTGKIETTKDGVIVTFDSGRPGHLLHFHFKLASDKLTGSVADDTYPTTLIKGEFQRVK
jgi:hypothetical protein